MSTHGRKIVDFYYYCCYILLPGVAPVSWLPLVSPLGSMVCRCQEGAGDLWGVYVFLFRCNSDIDINYEGLLLEGSFRLDLPYLLQKKWSLYYNGCQQDSCSVNPSLRYLDCNGYQRDSCSANPSLRYLQIGGKCCALQAEMAVLLRAYPQWRWNPWLMKLSTSFPLHELLRAIFLRH